MPTSPEGGTPCLGGAPAGGPVNLDSAWVTVFRASCLATRLSRLVGETSLDGGLWVVFPFWSGSLALPWNLNLAAWIRGFKPGCRDALALGECKLCRGGACEWLWGAAPGVCTAGGAVLLGSGGVLLVKSGAEPVLGPFSSILVALGDGTVGREEPIKSPWEACLSIPGLTKAALVHAFPFAFAETRGLPVEDFTGTVKGTFFT